MEFRWLVRTVLSARRPLLSLSSPSLFASVPKAHSVLAIRHFTRSSPRFPTDNSSLPTGTATETPEAEATPTPAPTPPTPTDSIADLFDLVAKTGTAPKRRDFGSVLPPEYASGINPNSPPLGARPIPRTGPSAGRSVSVVSDLPQALSRLRGIITANNVKADQVRQRFHERPGMKKKRLKSLRHRRRFKAGFKKLVEIAMDMKRKGL